MINIPLGLYLYSRTVVISAGNAVQGLNNFNIFSALSRRACIHIGNSVQCQSYMRANTKSQLPSIFGVNIHLLFY